MRKVESPVEKFPGVVELSEPFTMPQALAWERAIREMASLEDEDKTILEFDNLILPVIFEMVEKWNIEGLPENVTPETFPATPRTASAELIGWLVKEIGIIYKGEELDPNPS